MPIRANPQLDKEMPRNLGIKVEDIVAFFILLILTLGATAYLQYLIANALENADYINTWFVSP